MDKFRDIEIVSKFIAVSDNTVQTVAHRPQIPHRLGEDSRLHEPPFAGPAKVFDKPEFLRAEPSVEAVPFPRGKVGIIAVEFAASLRSDHRAPAPALERWMTQRAQRKPQLESI